MKKILVLVLFLGLVGGLVLPGRGLAQASDASIQALQAQIQALLAQIAQLQSQMAATQGGGLYQDPSFRAYSSEPGPTVNINPEKKFSSGDRVRSTFDLNVRETPGGKSLAIVKPYTQGTISAGPENSGGYFWWRINYDSGVTGFSVGDFLEKLETYLPATNGNQAPVLEETSLVSPTSVGAGDSNWWRLRASDPEGGKVIYKVNWGDGTSNTYIMPSFKPATDNPLYASDVPAQPGTDVAATHIYANPGFYTIQMVVTDEQGVGASRSLSVEVISKGSIATKSTKFAIGDKVQTTDYLNVRTRANGVPIGTQPPGKIAEVTSGPVWSILGKWWWGLDYEDGVDGWSAEDWLDKTTKDRTSLTPSITVTSPNGGELWRMGSANYINWRMPSDQIYHVELYLMPQGSTPVITTPPAPGTSGVVIDSRVGGYGFGGLTLNYLSAEGSYTAALGSQYPAGTYRIRAYLLPKDVTSLDLSKVIAQDESDVTFSIFGSSSTCGDIDGNGVINQNDLDNPASENDLTGYVFGGVPIPTGVNTDLNGDGVPSVLDITTLINYLNRGGAAPTCTAPVVNNTPSVSITSPSSGTTLTPGTVATIAWAATGSGYDKYQIVVGNTVMNTERQLYDRVSMVDFIPASQTSFPWNVPDLLNDFAKGTSYSFDQIKNAFYLQVRLVKNDSAGGGYVGSPSERVMFSVPFSATKGASGFVCGDVDQDGAINSADLTKINEYVFGGLAIPDNKLVDLNADGAPNIIDVTLLTNFLNRGGAAPTCGGQGSQAPTIAILSGPNVISPSINAQMQVTPATLYLKVNTVDPESGMINYVVDWGDGTKSISEYSAASGANISMSHVYSGGKFIVRVTAKDPSGLEAVKSHLVEVPRSSGNNQFAEFGIDSRSGIPAKSLIISRDTQGVLTGVAIDNESGNFLLRAYGDNVSTPTIDEGHVLGELVKIYANGQACVFTEGTAIWAPGGAKSVVLSCGGTSMNLQDSGISSLQSFQDQLGQITQQLEWILRSF